MLHEQKHSIRQLYIFFGPLRKPKIKSDCSGHSAHLFASSAISSLFNFLIMEGNTKTIMYRHQFARKTCPTEKTKSHFETFFTRVKINNMDNIYRTKHIIEA